MVDDRLAQLLHDCDQYVARQRQLLLRAAVLGCPEDSVAMEAALDQLAAGVAYTWRAALADELDDHDKPGPEPPDHFGCDPGE